MKKTTENKLHASKASIWSKCPGSHHIKSSPNPLDDYTKADYGTAIHALCEKILRDGAGKVEKDLPFEQQEALANGDPVFVLDCIDRYVGRIERDFAGDKKSKLIVEEKFLYQNLSGTVDAAIIKGNEITVYDLKTGQDEVLAENNIQLKIYGHMIAKKYKIASPVLIGVIVQPALQQILSAEYIYSPDFLDRLLNNSALGGKDFKTGPHCRYCSHNDICPTFRGKLEAFLSPEFADESIDRQAIYAEILDIGKPVIQMLEKSLANALALVKLGVQIDGYELKFRNGKRAWQNGLNEKQIMDVLGLPAKEVFESKLKSPTEIEKVILKKKNKNELTDKLRGLINQPQYGYLLKVEKEFDGLIKQTKMKD